LVRQQVQPDPGSTRRRTIGRREIPMTFRGQVSGLTLRILNRGREVSLSVLGEAGGQEH
jgi:hypothetical protein